MTSRHFGNPTSGPILGGNEQPGRSQRAYSTPRDLYPLPANSLCDDPMADVERNRAAGRFATIFFSLVFLIPMICIGVIKHFS